VRHTSLLSLLVQNKIVKILSNLTEASLPQMSALMQNEGRFQAVFILSVQLQRMGGKIQANYFALMAPAGFRPGP
jgi:hypothetical protein